jgi:hypothetical protein
MRALCVMRACVRVMKMVRMSMHCMLVRAYVCMTCVCACMCVHARIVGACLRACMRLHVCVQNVCVCIYGCVCMRMKHNYQSTRREVLRSRRG